MECPRCKEITLEVFAKYLHGKLVWAEYECLNCHHYEQMSQGTAPTIFSRRAEHENFFMGYNADKPPRSGL